MMNRYFQRKLLSIIGMTTMTGFASLPAEAVQEVVHLKNIVNPLVPTQVLEGDREFGGNGPDIDTRLTLEIDPSRTQIFANIYFKARETKADWSTTEATWKVPVFHTMPGQTINSIADKTNSSTHFRSKPAGPQFGFPGEDWAKLIDIVVKIVNEIEGRTGERVPIPPEFPECRTVVECGDLLKKGVLAVKSDNYVHIKQPDDGGPVAAFMIVGDTGGDDISDDLNPKDDTRVQGIAFRDIVVDLSNPGVMPEYRPGSSDAVSGAAAALTASTESNVSAVGNTCVNSIQGKIAWDYSGKKTWAQSNLDKLCLGAENSIEPGKCFNHVMHGKVNWGGGTNWQWGNALNLCAGTLNAKVTVECFEKNIKQGRPWSDAIASCKAH